MNDLLLTLAFAPVKEPNLTIRFAAIGFLLINAIALAFVVLGNLMDFDQNTLGIWRKRIKHALIYEVLGIGAIFMVTPFYWMLSTSFKDRETAISTVPEFMPKRSSYTAPDAAGKGEVEVRVIGTIRNEGDPRTVIPTSEIKFEADSSKGFTIHKETWDKAKEYKVEPDKLKRGEKINLSLQNFRQAWYSPEEGTRGRANFTRYFAVSIGTSLLATMGTLFTGALAAFAFARFEFVGKGVLFYIILATMMVPGQVLLIPNFLILDQLGWLDTFYALTVPWLASVFTIFLMRQFFMTVPNDLWEAARIDGASHFRYLWQIIVPLCKPVFITAGIFNFLNNWNSLLWPLIVTSRPEMRTLMVGLQTFTEDAGTDFHLLMAASTMAILPIVILFFLMQRFFIEGIARSGLK